MIIPRSLAIAMTMTAAALLQLGAPGVAAASAAGGLGRAAVAAKPTGSPPQSPTTIVVVLADDVDDVLLPLFDVMPNLMALAQDGMTFSNSFVRLIPARSLHHAVPRTAMLDSLSP